MRDHHDPSALFVFVLKQVEHHLAVGGVKVARRLVGDEERGIQDESARAISPGVGIFDNVLLPERRFFTVESIIDKL